MNNKKKVTQDQSFWNTSEVSLQWSIDRLTKIIDQRTSLKYKIYSGIISWVTTVIGATVVAWVVIYVLGAMVKQIDLSSIPYLQDVIDASNLLEE